MRLQYRTLLTLCLIGVFGFVVVSTWNLPIQARLFPWTVGIIGLGLLALQLFRELRPAQRVEVAEASGADMDFSADEASAVGRAKTIELFGWVYGFVLGLWLVGYYIAIPLMVLLFLLRHKESPILLLLLPIGVWIATWAIFDRLLHLPFPRGELFEWLGVL
jgi:hypothetical protein